jgi:phosphoglucosamine mutase
MRKLFGTDGIRGRANIYPMTCEVAVALGRAVTHYFKTQTRGNQKPLIIVGKDTRLSCYMLEQAFSAGVCSQGGRVILTGPLPTPAVAFVTQSMRANAGVMISASHNAYEDNGIKIFDANGNKLPDSVELELERMIENPSLIPVAIGADLGNAKRLDEVFGRYIVYAKSAFSSNYDLNNMRIVLDCANGASYRIGPMIYSELGAEIIPLGVKPNGVNINEMCGALHPDDCQENVKKFRADLGICLDGDADRIVIVDELGNVVDGDKLIGLFARLLLDQGKLKTGDTVVGTVMTNLGLENYLKAKGLNLHRADVGDRYIIEYMSKNKSILGGEPSGHIIFREHATTGDGILAGLKLIEAMKYYEQKVSELFKNIELYPNVLKNVKITQKLPLHEVSAIQKAIKLAEEKMGTKGRILIRYSGTEPLARVMVEGEDKKLVTEMCGELASTVEKALK